MKKILAIIFAATLCITQAASAASEAQSLLTSPNKLNSSVQAHKRSKSTSNVIFSSIDVPVIAPDFPKAVAGLGVFSYGIGMQTSKTTAWGLKWFPYADVGGQQAFVASFKGKQYFDDHKTFAFLELGPAALVYDTKFSILSGYYVALGLGYSYSDKLDIGIGSNTLRATDFEATQYLGVNLTYAFS
jgi:hypothetical protein